MGFRVEGFGVGLAAWGLRFRVWGLERGQNIGAVVTRISNKGYQGRDDDELE